MEKVLGKSINVVKMGKMQKKAQMHNIRRNTGKKKDVTASK